MSSSGHLVPVRGILEVGEVPLLVDPMPCVSTLAVTGVAFPARPMRLLAAGGGDLLLRAARRRHAAGGRNLIRLRGLGAC